MLLRRIGCKDKIAHEIIKHFPAHDIYMECMFGTGSIFFNKPLAKYNYVNDLDNEVFNFFQVILNQKDQLLELFEAMPIHITLFKHWLKNKEIDPIKQALRFLFLSNFSYMGRSSTIRFTNQNNKKIFLSYLDKTIKKLKYVLFNNTDFETFLKNFNFIDEIDKNRTFVYFDPPYLRTTNNYGNSWGENDTIRLFEVACNFGCRFAISEFSNPKILSLAKEFKLNVIEIKTRQTLKNRNTEILITNYDTINKLF